MFRLTRAALGLGLLIGAAAQASTTFIDFNQDPTLTVPPLVTSITGSGANGGQWIPYSGIGYVTNASDGFLQITAAVDSQNGKVIFPDFDNGQIVQGFSFDCYVRIGNGTNGTTPADGFSINYARTDDPVLTGGQFAEGPDGEFNLPEEGTTTGIAIGFDAYANGGSAPFPTNQLPNIGPDIVALSVRVDGLLILQSPMPVLNGDVTNALSLQTGPNDGTGSRDSLGWAHLVVNLDTTGLLNVYYKGTQLLTNYPTGYVPGPGRLVLAGRTGGLDQYQDVDDITITTTIAQNVTAGTAATGLGDGVSVPFFDSGVGVVDTTKAATMSIDGGPAIAPTTIAKNGGTTTLFYYGYPNYLVPGSAHTVVASVTDVFGRVITTSTLSFTVQPYSIVDSAYQVTGVNTATPGFRVLPWQSGTEPNDTWWSKEQLAGLQGTNEAYLTLATDNGYIDFTDVLNFNNNPAAIGGTDAGNFTSANGYGDGLFPGLPGPNGLNGSTALEVLAFLQFPSPGVYTMGVNSDDGFDLTIGHNPADWGAFSLGQYNGGRGSSDTIFTFVVTNTSGFYPVCLTWENGSGELPGNGANLEWFVVHNGVKMLVNDPSPTNTSGVKVYYGGPALPAYVSDLRPNPDRTTFRPDQFLGMITDLGTTVTGTPLLFLDGAQLTSAVVSQANGVTTVSAPSSLLLTVGAHSAMLVYSTSGGGPFTNAWKFTVGNYFLASWAVTGVDTTQPGFRLKPFQSYVWPNSYGGQPNNNRWTLEQLSGLHGANAANLTTATDGGFIDYVADISGTPNGTINFIINPPGTAGNFANKTGFPGLTLGTDIPDIGDESIDVLCFLQFSAAGVYTMGVNSDDGFAVFGGANPSDWFTGALFGEFSGGRGPGDTTFSVFVPVAGTYPVRMFWENGNGSASGGNGAACEWFVVQPDGTKVLLNDPNVDTGVKAYFKGPALPAYVSAFCPAAGATGVSQYPAAAGLSTSAFGVQLTDGSTTVTPGSIEVFINGTAMTPVVSQSSGTPKVTTVTLPASNPLVPGTNYAQFVYSTSGGGPFTNAWGFTVATNTLPVVNSAWAVTGVATANKGFQYRPWQSPGQNNTVQWTEEQLAGLHGPNNADLSILNDGKYYDYTGLVNLDIGTSHSGDFVPQTQFYPNYPDVNFPGIPGANGQTDNSSFEMLTWLQFNQAGIYAMCVNSDDGFKVTVGPNPADWFALNVGQYNGGRGAGWDAGTTFSFVITAPGFYPFRLIWENGGGGCNVEWTMVQPDGTRILINDPNAPENTQVTAYYKGPALAAGITAVTPSPGASDGLGSLQIKLADNGTPVTDGSISLMIDGVGVNPTISKANGISTITYDTIAAGTHTNTLCYSTSAGGPFCTTWTFTTTAAPDGGPTLPVSLWTPPGSGNNQGFAFKVFQSPNTNIFNGWQNNSRMADMMLQGLYGPNVADLTDFTNNGAMWLPGVINFASTDPTPANAQTAGNFVASTWPDALFPGLGVYVPPDSSYFTNGTTTMNYDAIEAKTFLEFSKAGYYVMGVSSDDGFRVTVGDQGAPGKSPLAILAPAGLAGEMTSVYTTTADGDGNRGFGITPPSTVPIIGRVVLADPIDASTALVNAAALKGNIAFIQRGVVAFTAKYDAARDAGAVAVIIANNSANDTPANQYPGTMGGTDNTNTIPVLWVNYVNGTNLIAAATTDASSPLIARITAQDCSTIIGVDDVGKGASDVLFGFTVPQPGVYPFRLIWENGTGGANCEWFIRDPALGDFLVGDPAGPVKAWITRDVNFAGALPAPKLNTPTLSGGNVMISWTGEGELWEAYSINGPWFKSTYQANPSTVVPSPLPAGQFFRVRQY